MCKTGASGKRPDAKGLRQRLTQVSKSGTYAKIHPRTYRLTVGEQWYMLACVIGATIGRVYTMVGSKENGVSWPQKLLYLCKPCVHVLQRLCVTHTISTMAPQHIKFYQVDKEQSAKVLLEPTQGRGHTIAVGLGMVSLCEPASCKEVFDL